MPHHVQNKTWPKPHCSALWTRFGSPIMCNEKQSCHEHITNILYIYIYNNMPLESWLHVCLNDFWAQLDSGMWHWTQHRNECPMGSWGGGPYDHGDLHGKVPMIRQTSTGTVGHIVGTAAGPRNATLRSTGGGAGVYLTGAQGTYITYIYIYIHIYIIYIIYITCHWVLLHWLAHPLEGETVSEVEQTI